MRIVIIGAGVLGSSLAYRLARAGQRVTLVERAGAAQGTTGSSFAWINSNQKTPEDYYALNLAGMVAHRELREDLAEAPWLNEGGNLVWSSGGENANELEGRVARLRGWGYRAEWLGREAVRELEPNLNPEPEVEQIAWFPDEAWINGPALAERFCALAAEQGATPRFLSQVRSIEQTGGRVTGVTLADGERIAADVVVNCAGPGAGAVARLAGRELPMASTPGLVVRVSNASGLIGRVIHAPEIHMRPDADGSVMLHHGDADLAMARGETPRAWIDTFFERAAAYVPGFAEARLSRWSIGIRPIPGDGRTSAGLVAAIPGYAEIVTHSGITLGPLLSQLVARQIIDGETDPLLKPFTPERFA
ncbi:MAG: FAD-binding oxidoreductase [Thermomicrobiales bacterium]